jgi:hypothetical protein
MNEKRNDVCSQQRHDDRASHPALMVAENCACMCFTISKRSRRAPWLFADREVAQMIELRVCIIVARVTLPTVMYGGFAASPQSTVTTH